MHRLPIGRSILLILTAVACWLWWSGRPLRHAPGILVLEGPVQENIAAEVMGAKSFHPVETNGAARAAAMLAELI